MEDEDHACAADAIVDSDSGQGLPYLRNRHIEAVTRQPLKWRIGHVIVVPFFLLICNSVSLYSIWNVQNNLISG